MAYKQETSGLMFDTVMMDKREYSQQQIDLLGIDDCIGKLSPQHQDLIRYVYYEGYTHDEAAKVLEIPLGTAKSRIKAAVGQLRVLAN
jgi:RNA polymerase sigma-70 factor (ECF subfamily)